MADSQRAGDEKRDRVSQTDFPNHTISQAMRIAEALWENFAGKSAAPHQIAMAIQMSPTSGTWRNLCGSAIAFGLTEGGYNASQITLTDLGKRVVAPTEEGEDAGARVEAILKPRIMREFFQKYDKAKFPKDEIARNVLVGMGLPKDRAERALEDLKAAGDFAGIILQTKSGPFVALDTPAAGRNQSNGSSDAFSKTDDVNALSAMDFLNPKIDPAAPVVLPPAANKISNKVFISHGKNKKILGQVKEIVQFGKFEPVISQERETVSKPVPEKVLDDMRACSAAVIHVGVDGYLMNEAGEKVPQLNGNVLIEIGAAMALYRRNFILLVEQGVVLPSNLQGLYECRYSGDELGMDATMKLLKVFNEFRLG